MLARLSSAPGLPVEEPTAPYWMDEAPFGELADVQDEIPPVADVVIIGSGMTGVAVAKHILEQSTLSVTVLEARQLCSGATARNGGHIKPPPFADFSRLRAQLGERSARKVVACQLRHLPVLLALGAEHPLGEVREVDTLDVFVDEEDFQAVRREVVALREWMPEVEVEVVAGEEARCRFGLKEHIVGAVAYKAGALFPFRLVTSLWHGLAERYADRLRLRTHSPVTAVWPTLDAAYPLCCRLHNTITTTTTTTTHNNTTTTTTIAARHIVHATNAFAPHLVPALRSCLTGALGHMTSQRASPPMLSPRTSCSIFYGPDMYDYATHRAAHDLIGGGLFCSRAHGLDQFGIWDDSCLDYRSLAHLHGSLAAVYGPRSVAVSRAWSGIMAFTGDGLPLVGGVPGRRGEWVAAGYCGDGMVWAWLCGAALASMLLGAAEGIEDWFPVKEVAITEARLGRANLRHLVEQLV
ncbi:hypothetical protein CDD81_2057 [Ophiocordyceps australis]|uniref:FAD dependent oxidoreductase domain-containing protein n=1 Tax=Ophiocordyceps australis TaxID=1399860 RepID=A0A2C5XZX0_9HYPO|nr:hypothetical protein CDD81_2057 [Ophiocordyceps australis]